MLNFRLILLVVSAFDNSNPNDQFYFCYAGVAVLLSLFRGELRNLWNYDFESDGQQPAEA